MGQIFKELCSISLICKEKYIPDIQGDISYILDIQGVVFYILDM